jgi:hypothetical protein
MLALSSGWVAMWRPLEVWLHDWWPTRGEIRLLDLNRSVREERRPPGLRAPRGLASRESMREVDWPGRCDAPTAAS